MALRIEAVAFQRCYGFWAAQSSRMHGQISRELYIPSPETNVEPKIKSLLRGNVIFQHLPTNKFQGTCHKYFSSQRGQHIPPNGKRKTIDSKSSRTVDGWNPALVDRGKIELCKLFLCLQQYGGWKYSFIRLVWAIKAIWPKIAKLSSFTYSRFPEFWQQMGTLHHHYHPQKA